MASDEGGGFKFKLIQDENLLINKILFLSHVKSKFYTFYLKVVYSVYDLNHIE